AWTSKADRRASITIAALGAGLGGVDYRPPGSVPQWRPQSRDEPAVDTFGRRKRTSSRIEKRDFHEHAIGLQDATTRGGGGRRVSARTGSLADRPDVGLFDPTGARRAGTAPRDRRPRDRRTRGVAPPAPRRL